MKSKLKKIAPFISIIFFGLAVWFLDQELRQYDLSEVSNQLSAIPNIYILFSLILSLLSYLVLTAYDGLGVTYIGEELAPSKVVRAGFIGYAFSHNIGLALITGGSIRYRIYSAWGFSAIQVTQIVAFSAFTLWIGFCTVAGLALLLATPNLPNDVTIPFGSLRILGSVLLVMVVGYMVASAKFTKEISFKKWSFTFPSFSIALKQVVIASLDWLMAASVLYVLLPDVGINFFSFAGVFLLAQILGLFSQVPGGLGVFESVMLLYLTNFMEGPQVLGIMVLYRIIYYIFPLLVAMIILGYQEYKTNEEVMQQLGQKAVNWFPRIVPEVLSVSIFIGGAILLFSGYMPSEVPRMEWLQSFLPLPVIEMSHFFASLVGAVLLILARSLQHRIQGAYHLTVGMLVFGILFSLLKGGDYEEAIILFTMLMALIPCKNEFNRKTSLFDQKLSFGWIALVMMVIFSAFWLGTFSLRNIEYQKEVWWQFTLLGDAPRYLRATVGILGFTIIMGLIKLLKPRQRATDKPDMDELKIAEGILSESPDTKSNIVLLGDKELMFGPEHKTFLMYAHEGKSRIAMGDPVGDSEEVEELLWEFKEECEYEDMQPVFYQVSDKYLNYYVDLGLSLLKLGEQARVKLEDFDLQDEKYQELNQSRTSFLNEGYEFEIIPKEQVKHHLVELKRISDKWIEEKDATERGYAHGVFEPEYLQRFPVAAVRKEGEIVAFANIWTGAEHYEISYDLLRNTTEVDRNVIDFLLIEMMLWGKGQGYTWFDMGMAPLSGMEDNQHSMRWNKVADWVYTYGQSLYNFQEFRKYREKFHPVWEPRFLAAPGGWAIPGVLSNLTSLISGGFRVLLK